MGYLDNAGLQYLWGKLKEKFAPKSHSHDDRYYTEAEMDGKLSGKADNTRAGANDLINKLESGTAVPVDNDLIVTQWANHTTATAADQNRYVRRPMSSIWSYIKSKADSVYQPKGNYSTTDTKNTAGSTNTTSKLYLIGSTSQSANPQTYSNASVYTTGSTIYANGFGNDIFIIYPSGGSASYGGQQIGYCKITLPTLWDSTMMTFTVTIYNYVSNTSVDYRISGYNYSGKPWYNCASVCVGKAGTSHSNLSVRFGDNGTKNVITIGEENTEWEYPRIVVHDVVIGNSNFETYKSGWNVEISKSGAPNVSETISNTHVGYNAITSWDKIQNKPSSFTPASHAHDDRYYTETEMNAKLDGKANSNHSHYSITTVADNRNTNTTPNDYRNTLIFQGLKDNSKINSPSSDTYSYLLGLRGWSDSSGGNSHELAFNNTGVYWRNGSSEWGGWNRLYTENYHPNADHASSSDYATNATNATTATKLSSNAGSNIQPVYFSGGKPVVIGYTIAKSVPADAKFTDTTYGVASSTTNGLMSSTDKTKLDDFSRVISIQKQIKLTTDWQDTGIAGNNLETGTYIIQVSGFNSSYTSLYNEVYSGIMTWYANETNSDNSSEIFLHNAGHADNSNAIYLRTSRRAYGNGGLHLQIACKVAATGTDTLTFKFRRLI